METQLQGTTITRGKGPGSEPSATAYQGYGEGGAQQLVTDQMLKLMKGQIIPEQKVDKKKAYLLLEQLVEKNIHDDKEKKELLDVLQNEKYMLPVRGIVDDILKQSDQISKNDKDLIDDLMYYFG